MPPVDPSAKLRLELHRQVRIRLEVAHLNIGIRLPSVMAPDMAELKRFVLQVEAAGFHSIWAGDHVFHATDVLAPIDILSYVAAITDRVGLLAPQ